MSVAERFYPEIGAGGFSRVDGTVQFYTRVNALLRREHVVLDFGAGRGWHQLEDAVDIRRELITLRGRCAKIIGVDVDVAVKENPFLDESYVLSPKDALPLEDESVDMIVADHVFEHVDNPQHVAREFRRVLRPNGWVCARTPNRWGYIAIGARLVPNALHSRLLQRIQPGRQAKDVFPTVYKLNTKAALRDCFPLDRFEHFTYGFNSEPTYVGNSRLGWLLLSSWFRVAPECLSATWLVFMRKRTADTVAY